MSVDRIEIIGDTISKSYFCMELRRASAGVQVNITNNDIDKFARDGNNGTEISRIMRLATQLARVECGELDKHCIYTARLTYKTAAV
jgi:hypothetical protein